EFKADAICAKSYRADSGMGKVKETGLRRALLALEPHLSQAFKRRTMRLLQCERRHRYGIATAQHLEIRFWIERQRRFRNGHEKLAVGVAAIVTDGRTGKSLVRHGCDAGHLGYAAERKVHVVENIVAAMRGQNGLNH